MTRIYAATTNAGKLREFAECAQGEGVEVLALPGLGEMPEPVEDAATFMGNAELKAVAYSRAAMARGKRGLMVFADDSGLEVEALGGRPGVRSARFADEMGWSDEGATKDERNNACLLALLRELPGRTEAMSWPEERAGGRRAPRRARFVCALALAREGEVVLRAEGAVEGEMLEAPRGANGFGYDPLFLLPGLGWTMAELGAEGKWAVSHRGQAFRSLVGQLPGIAQNER